VIGLGDWARTLSICFDAVLGALAGKEYVTGALGVAGGNAYGVCRAVFKHKRVRYVLNYDRLDCIETYETGPDCLRLLKSVRQLI